MAFLTANNESVIFNSVNDPALSQRRPFQARQSPKFEISAQITANIKPHGNAWAKHQPSIKMVEFWYGTTFTSETIDTVQTQSASGTIVARDGLLLAFGGLIEEMPDQRSYLGDIHAAFPSRIIVNRS